MATSEEINQFKLLLQSHYGPNSSSSIFVNKVQHEALIFSSLALTNQLSFKNSLLSILKESISVQNRTYGNFGLYTGLLACSLLGYDASIFKDSSLYGIIFEDINKLFLGKVHLFMSIFQSSLDFNSVNELNSFCRCIIGSKGKINATTVNILTQTIVKAFIRRLPVDNSCKLGQFHVVYPEPLCEGMTDVYNGFLYKVSDIASCLPLKNEKIVIFDIPLSDCNEDRKTICQQLDVRDVLTWYTEVLTSFLRKHDIKIIANQKYVHETIKLRLQRKGFLVLERLGLRLAQCLCSSLNICSISSIMDLDKTVSRIGIVEHLSSININGNLYYRIKSSHNNDITLFCGESDAYTSQFMEETIKICMETLTMTLQDASVVPGGGCFESMCSVILLQLKKEQCIPMSKSLGVNRLRLCEVFDVFLKAYAKIAIIPTGGKNASLFDYDLNLRTGHLYANFSQNTAEKMTCACGKFSVSEKTNLYSLKILLDMDYDQIPEIKDFVNHAECSDENHDNLLLDYFPAKMNALKLAFQCISELQRIGTCIY